MEKELSKNKYLPIELVYYLFSLWGLWRRQINGLSQSISLRDSTVLKKWTHSHFMPCPFYAIASHAPCTNCRSACVAVFIFVLTSVALCYFLTFIQFLLLNILLQHYLQSQVWLRYYPTIFHYCYSQSIVWQFVLIGLTTNVVNVILHTIAIYGIGLGFM